MVLCCWRWNINLLHYQPLIHPLMHVFMSTPNSNPLANRIADRRVRGTSWPIGTVRGGAVRSQRCQTFSSWICGVGHVMFWVVGMFNLDIVTVRWCLNDFSLITDLFSAFSTALCGQRNFIPDNLLFVRYDERVNRLAEDSPPIRCFCFYINSYWWKEDTCGFFREITRLYPSMSRRKQAKPQYVLLGKFLHDFLNLRDDGVWQKRATLSFNTTLY